MKFLRASLLLLLAVAVLSACRKDEQFTDDPGARLEFSRDTVLFDTVFTALTTSVTKRFTVRNRNDQAVRVDIALEGGSPSPYRINVDGASRLTFSQVEILGGDSLFVFVEVLPGQGGVNTPFIVEDRILFNTNGNEQEVLLVAWGQDAHIFRPDRSIPGFPDFSIIAGLDDQGNPTCETVTWPNDKPYVIYGYAVVDSCSTLQIDPGVKVYFHGSSGLWVYRYGRLLAQGTVDDPIIFQGDRLEPDYQDLPGQWDRIWLNEGAAGQDHELEHVEIRNSLIGIQCETFPLNPLEPTSEAKLKLDNAKIFNASLAGILSRNFRIESTNLLVADCGQYCVALTGGGQYSFRQSTLVNYWTWDIRQDPAFILTNTFQDITGTVQVRDVEASTFVNGMIYGFNTNEFLVEVDNAANVDYTFANWLFRTDQPTNDPVHFPDQASIYRNQAPAFVSIGSQDFHLTDQDNAARDRGQFIPDALFDLDGNLRDGQPDLGCYEFVP